MDHALKKQEEIDFSNHQFWDELCGTQAAKSLGISDHSQASLKKFDDWYFNFYPYLKAYLDKLPTGIVLEIGLGYGTISSYLAERSKKYFALDIAQGPVNIVNTRLLFSDKEKTAKVGSAHALPFQDNTLDAVVSIGCFHHTGNIEQCVKEAYRVLKKNGMLLFMCYNKHSFRMLKRFPISGFFSKQDPVRLSSSGASLYDKNSHDDGAPCTEVGSVSYYKEMCSRFSNVVIEKENWCSSKREKRLNNIAKILGLDLYVLCTK